MTLADAERLIWDAVAEYQQSDLCRICDEAERIYRETLDALYGPVMIVTTDHTWPTPTPGPWGSVS